MREREEEIYIMILSEGTSETPAAFSSSLVVRNIVCEIWRRKTRTFWLESKKYGIGLMIRRCVMIFARGTKLI